MVFKEMWEYTDISTPTFFVESLLDLSGMEKVNGVDKYVSGMENVQCIMYGMCGQIREWDGKN